MASHTAYRAVDFRHTIGVGTHLHYFDTAYGRKEKVAAAIASVPFAVVRETIIAHQKAATDPGARDWMLAQHHGLDGIVAASPQTRFVFILGHDDLTTFGTINQRLDMLSQKWADKALAIEGVNEPDIFWGDPNWPKLTADYQEQLYTAVKNHADHRIRALPVLCPSFGTGSGPSLYAAELKRRGTGPHADYGNIHPYTGGASPRTDHIDREFREHVLPVLGKHAAYATECGFHNAMKTTEPGAQAPTSEKAAAVYVIRQYLTHFRQGVNRTTQYELVDQFTDSATRSEHSFGLFRYDFSDKPAVVALRNMLSLIPEGPRPAASTIDFTINSGPLDLRALPLYRADGIYLLWLWREAPVWDYTKRADITVPAAGVKVTIPNAQRVRKSDPVAGGEPSAPLLLTDQALTIPIGGNPICLSIRMK